MGFSDTVAVTGLQQAANYGFNDRRESDRNDSSLNELAIAVCTVRTSWGKIAPFYFCNNVAELRSFFTLLYF